MNTFIDLTVKLGVDCKVWHYAVILDGCVLGDRVSVGACAEIGKGSVIGDDCRISHGVFLPSGSRLGARVFIGPNATFTDDRYPRVNHAEYDAQPPTIDDDAAIGAGAVILPGVHIGHHALIGAGAVVVKDVPPHAVVAGIPAKPLTPSPENPYLVRLANTTQLH